MIALDAPAIQDPRGRRATCAGVLLAALAVLGCDGAPGGPLPVTTARSTKLRVEKPVVPAADAATLAQDNTLFALALYDFLHDQPGNRLLSPTSLSLAAAMTFAGTRGNTADQMAATLHFSLPPPRLHAAFDALDLALGSRADGTGGTLALGTDGQPFRLTLSNAVWADRTLHVAAPFLDTLAENYGAGVQQLDFAGHPEPARLTINGWVAGETAGKISDLLPVGIITPLTRLVLTNAVYLNAAWQTPFTEPTMNYPFHRLDGSAVSVPMMLGKRGFQMGTGPGYRAAELPYSGGALSLVVIIPDDGTFSRFEASLTPALLDEILKGLGPSTDGLLLPKFRFEMALSLRDTLSALGMPDAFDPNAADLSGIDGGRDLYISDVVHKAFIAVSEKGTEAAAATGVVVSTRAAVSLLAIDRPFLFLIRDQPTGALLFLGRVVDPS